MQKKGNILIVDDHKNVLKALAQLLEPEYSEVITAHSPNTIPHLLSTGHIDVALLDMNFTAGIDSGNEGIFWMKEILKSDPNISVVLMTAYG
nr:response regulator [Bacteroidota bacterium]